MANDLTDTNAVEAKLLRPLTSTETNYIYTLINEGSQQLRNRVPAIDTRIARYQQNPADPGGVDPVIVAGVIAEAIKRYMVNPEGFATETDGMGPFSHSTAYALRSEKTARGVLQITDDDLAILFPPRKRLRAGMIRTRPALAPRPVGRYGPLPSFGEAVDAVITYSRTPVADLEALDSTLAPETPSS